MACFMMATLPNELYTQNIWSATCRHSKAMCRNHRDHKGEEVSSVTVIFFKFLCMNSHNPLFSPLKVSCFVICSWFLLAIVADLALKGREGNPVWTCIQAWKQDSWQRTLLNSMHFQPFACRTSRVMCQH